VPVVRKLWNGHSERRLVEPFCGGLAIALGLRPERALLNDVNPHLINFYRWVRRGLSVDLPMTNNRQVYDQRRREFNDLLARGEWQSKRAALLFYYLNRTGFNGLCRFNRRGGFNVPFGRYTSIRYAASFDGYRPLLRQWTFTTTDIARVPFRADDFVYADPPYDVEFTQYSRDGFRWSDQQRTAELLSRHPGPVVLVNQATDRILSLYRELGFSMETLSAPRRISCTGDRRPVREVIATRNL
jgi:DNA adenine methylase